MILQASNSISNANRIGKLPIGKLPIPAWQQERAEKLHRACQRLQAANAVCEPKLRALRRVARNFNGRKFKSKPARHTALSAGSLRRLFKVWKRGGKVPTALLISYRPRRSNLPAPLLVRLVEFYVRTNQPNLKAAWQQFSERPGGFGRGRHARRQKISYQKVCYHLTASGFFRLAAQVRAIATAQAELASTRFQVIANIRSRLPDRVARKNPPTSANAVK